MNKQEKNHPQRFCRKCLIRDLMEGEGFYVNLKAAIDAIPEEDRAEDALYEERLNICRSCERLYEGMCSASGCYVEVRGRKKREDCPYHLWTGSET